MILRKRLPQVTVGLIVLCYVFVAVQYARLTPPWQAPDEPAHYNYIRYVAENAALPILQPGDYPHDYLAQIVSDGFPAGRSIDPIRYESWQPPAYYCLGAIVYRLTAGQGVAQQLLALRLLSVVLGALLLVLGYQIVCTFSPARTWLAPGAVALMATIPMHVAMTAAINNDTLAEVCMALLLWQLLGLLRHPDAPLSRWLLLGVTLGLAGLTKLSTLTSLPLVIGTLAYVGWRWDVAARLRTAARRLLAASTPPLLMMLPWLAHNVRAYGLADPLAFARHSQVVFGQPRTVEWIRLYGLRHTASAFLVTTFQSFWGQFGWMGVPIDARLYRGLGVALALAGLGLVLRGLRLRREWPLLPVDERAGIVLFASSIALAALSLLWYNISFVQHQGRYLFPALIPIAVSLATGWHEVTRRGRRLLAAAATLLAAVLLVGHDTLSAQPWDKRLVAGLVGLAGTFGLGAQVPEAWSRWLYALPYPMLLLLDVACLYGCILPALALG